MRRRAWAAGWILAAGGCLSGPDGMTRVPSNPFVTQPHIPETAPHLTLSPGTQESAQRVLAIGGKIVAANRELGLRPRFTTIGSPKEELFHQGLQDVFITEG